LEIEIEPDSLEEEQTDKKKQRKPKAKKGCEEPEIQEKKVRKPRTKNIFKKKNTDNIKELDDLLEADEYLINIVTPKEIPKEDPEEVKDVLIPPPTINRKIKVTLKKKIT
jgi:hypothetical protein